jgi:hypothetical protein
MAAINFPLPANAVTQRLVGVIYAEASVGNTANHQAEKQAIAHCFLNMAYFAGLKQPNGASCFNSSFGDGTVLKAIQKGSVAYGGPNWNEVMSGDLLKSKASLEQILDAAKVAHLEKCVLAVTGMPTGGGPFTMSVLGNRAPLQFNRAADAPPNPQRQQKIGVLSAHTFYAFKSGRECQ